MARSIRNTPVPLLMDDDTKGRELDQWFSPTVNGETKGHGLDPRNLATYPPHMFMAPPTDMPLYPPSDWPDLIRERSRTKSNISAHRTWDALDQNGQGYCAVVGTPVAMADGSQKAIEDVRLGDLVLTNSLTPRRVLRTYRRLYTGDLLTFAVEGAAGTFTVTADHKIPTPRADGLGYYDVPADKWHPGASAFVLAGSQLVARHVSEVTRDPVRDLEVYDIGVEEEHYFLAGPGRVLVHNCWAYSTTSAVMLLRSLNGQPYQRLSAHAVGCKVKGFRDEGGWCGLSAKFHREQGCPTVAQWPEKSMSRSNDTPATWENAAKHKVTEDWVDLAKPVYDQSLTFEQVVSCLLNGIPCAVDFNWWSHSVCAMDVVEIEPGSYGLLILNSWSNNWSDRGQGILRGSKARPDGAVALRVTGASAA